MARLVAIVSGLLVFSESQASNQADRSNAHGFLSRILPFRSDSSRTPLNQDERFITPHLGERSFTALHNNQDSDLPKAAEEKGEAVQKLLALGNSTPVTLSAIGVGLFTLVMMLVARMRRGLQPATILASSGALGPNVFTDKASGLGDNIMEMKSQGSTIDGVAHAMKHPRKETSRRFGWGQLSSQNALPLTLSYAMPRDNETGSTVWEEFGALARQLEEAKVFTDGVANLGQGYPDWAPPAFVKAGLRNAASDESASGHQYARSAGHPPLVNVIARRYSAHLGRSIDAFSEVAVTVGATQALLVCLLALVSRGDEVVLPEPFFDLYLGQVKLTGGVARPAPMVLDASNEWRLSPDVLRQAISPRTRVVVVNSPHNPTGKVFDRSELEAIASVVSEENARRAPDDSVVVIADEVYKYIVHGEGIEHVHFASLPGMRDCTLTVSSAGKTFSATGWQVGWIIGPQELVAPCQKLLPMLQFCAPTPVQAALATCLDAADAPYEGLSSYYIYLRHAYARKRQVLADALTAACIEPLPSSGGYFILGDVSNLIKLTPESYFADGKPADWGFCRWLGEKHGVVAIPASPFFSEETVRPLVRFAFCKSDEVLAVAAERLKVLADRCSVV
jgi:kynurenine--oxoglutarate transaminase/cysteine-S-conjugate beta-lyase/glutamine--phenylpyruvate transaminase